jgi:hypothetical protein
MRMKWEPWKVNPNWTKTSSTVAKIEISEFDYIWVMLLDSTARGRRELTMTATDGHSQKVHAQIWREPEPTSSREAFQNLAEEIIMVYLRRRRDSFSRVIAEMGG